jgi:hypothetical protein
VTFTTNSTAPAIRLAKVTDPKSGTTNPVKVAVPDVFMTAAKKRIDARPRPELKDGKPHEFFTYYYYVPDSPNILVVDLDKPLDKQP